MYVNSRNMQKYSMVVDLVICCFIVHTPGLPLVHFRDLFVDTEIVLQAWCIQKGPSGDVCVT